jgi:hypothetical protein
MADNPRELIAALLELLDKAIDVASKLEGSELGTDLQTVRDKLGDLREAVVELREENVELRERVRTLEASFGKREELVRHKGVYWVRRDPDPWCPVCWEKDQAALHLNRTDLLAGRLCQCPKCGYNVNLDNAYPPREWQED